MGTGGEGAVRIIEPPSMPNARVTHRPLSSSFLGLPYRILNMNQKKEPLRGLWVRPVWYRRNGAGCLISCAYMSSILGARKVNLCAAIQVIKVSYG